MTITNITPFFVLIYVFFLTAKFIVKHVDFFRQAVQKSAQAKYQTLDGLRGFLALSVFFHHSVISYYFFKTGEWKIPPSNFYTFLGQGAVAFFFMITGFLFWSKAIAKGKFNIKEFYIARISRVYPMYLFSFILILLIVSVISHFNLKVSWLDLFTQIISWLALGITRLDLFNEVDFSTIFLVINHIEATRINAGVTWTLVYELQFYLLLPFLVIFAKPFRFLLLFVFILILHQKNPAHYISMSVIFLFGMAAAHLFNQFQLSKFISHWIFSIAIIILLVAIPTIFSNVYPENTTVYLENTKVLFLIFTVFLLLVYGNNLFGLLTSAPARYLGIISYDIYLLHGIVLYVGLRSINKFYPIENINPIVYWLFVGFCGVIIVCISGITHRFIEYPYMQAKPKRT